MYLMYAEWLLNRCHSSPRGQLGPVPAAQHGGLVTDRHCVSESARQLWRQHNPGDATVRECLELSSADEICIAATFHKTKWDHRTH